MCKQFFVEYESDKFNHGMYNKETGEYGCYIHFGGNASSIRNAKAVIRQIRYGFASENPRNFKIYDSWADVNTETHFVPCVYSED